MDVRNEVAEIEVCELREELRRGAELVDVREYPEYAARRVAGARLIPLGEISRRSGEIDRCKPVHLICRTGRRSAEAQRVLVELGFERVVNVSGGLTAWDAEGFPVIQDRKAPWALERQVRLVAGLLVVAGVLLGALVAPPFVWLAGFVGAGLVVAAITDSCLMGTMLARLPWNRQSSCRIDEAGSAR